LILPLGGLEAVGVLLLTCTSLLLLGDTSMTSLALLSVEGLQKCCWITWRHRIAKCRRVAKDRWIAKGCWIAKYYGIAKDCLIAKCCWTSNVLIASNFPIANNFAIAS
jgi:hypothetical protein